MTKLGQHAVCIVSWQDDIN